MPGTIWARHDADTGTLTYIVSDDSKKCFVVDTVMEYDVRTSSTSTDCINEIMEYINEKGLELEWILDTHAHADHISGSIGLADKYEEQFKSRPKRGIGEHIKTVQTVFKNIYDLKDLPEDASQFDHVFTDGETFSVGDLCIQVLHTPGHTPACVSYYIKGSEGDPGIIFVGDSIFMPDAGTARCDFPGGCCSTLYDSIQKILSLPEDTIIYVCHDYGPGGRDIAYKTTVKEELESNKHVKKGTSQDDFISMRKERDGTLSLPRLLIPSIQININGGALPAPEDNGISYLKFPLNLSYSSS